GDRDSAGGFGTGGVDGGLVRGQGGGGRAPGDGDGVGVGGEVTVRAKQVVVTGGLVLRHDQAHCRQCALRVSGTRTRNDLGTAAAGRTGVQGDGHGGVRGPAGTGDRDSAVAFGTGGGDGFLIGQIGRAHVWTPVT